MDQRLIWFFMFVFVDGAFGKSCIREPRCSIQRIHGMKSADCYQKDMRNIPQCISSDIEILDLSYNRIRKIAKNDLNRYSYLQILYLSDNMIVTIDEDAFTNLDYLYTIDLTMNSLQKLPPVIFQLPSLKALYLGQNLNVNLVDAIEKTKPISSPLGHLDISYLTDEDPIELPDFGVIPSLVKLNISGNWYTDLGPKHFAGLCNLKYLVTVNVTAEFNNTCDCWLINHWLKERKVDFSPFTCSNSEKECLLKDVTPEDMEIFSKCTGKLKEIQTKATVKKALIISGICAGVVAAVVLIWLYVRRNRRNRKKLRNMIQPNAPLLNNQTMTFTKQM